MWGVVALLLALVVALPAYRWHWARQERNPLGYGLQVLRQESCVACHMTPDGQYRWRADGTPPPSVEVVRDAVVNGRKAANGFPGRMPAYGARLTVERWQGAVVAVAVLSGLIGVPEDPELAAGQDVAVQMGCFGCHGPLGAGGVANPGSLSGAVPGWYGGAFQRVVKEPGGLEQFLRDGGKPHRVPFPGLPGPLLSMPPFGDRLDSTESSLLSRYVKWLNANPPAYPHGSPSS